MKPDAKTFENVKQRGGHFAAITANLGISRQHVREAWLAGFDEFFDLLDGGE
jgi:hypothetical protein